MSDLQTTIEQAWEARDKVNLETKGPVRDAVNAALELLDQFCFDEQLGGAASDLVELFCCARHSSARVDPALRRG